MVHILESLVDISSSLGGLLLNDLAVALQSGWSTFE